MPQNKILLDSNSYFRLAKSIHPLLFSTFGKKEYCLYVLVELEKEWNRSSRLQSKFSWVNEPEYQENRTKHLKLSRKELKELSVIFDFIWQEIQSTSPGPSRIDAQHLAYGYFLDIPVVTDDQDMYPVAKAFGIKIVSTLKLLNLMLVNEHIDIQKVRQIAAYWTYEGDTPAKFHAEFRQLFKEEPPVG